MLWLMQSSAGGAWGSVESRVIDAHSSAGTPGSLHGRVAAIFIAVNSFIRLQKRSGRGFLGCASAVDLYGVSKCVELKSLS